MDESRSAWCGDDELAALVSLISGDAGDADRELEAAIRSYPEDPRLRFLSGSVLAGRQDYAAALVAIQMAIDLDPGYAIARFQLGLLQLTSGRPDLAIPTWRPLSALPPSDPLRLFASGLEFLIADRFEEAARKLEEGIARNGANQPLNRDMRMVLAEMRGRQASGGNAEDALSSTQLLLRQSSIRPTRH